MTANNVVNEQRSDNGSLALPTGVVCGQLKRVAASKTPKRGSPTKGSPELKALGARIRARREELGHKSLSRFADLVGIDKGALSRIENGHNVPELETTKKLSVHLGQPLDWFVSDDEAETGDTTPHTPPAHSGPRATRPSLIERIPEYIDDWFTDFLQNRGDHGPYSPTAVRWGKLLVANLAFKVRASGPRKIVLGALEAARQLEASGEPMELGALIAMMAERSAPESGPTPAPGERAKHAHRSAAEELIAKEERAAKRRGHVPPKR